MEKFDKKIDNIIDYDLEDFTYKDVLNACNEYWENFKKVYELKTNEKPEFYLLAGQSGAGKSNIKNRIVENEDFSGMIVDVDDFREYHPNYKKIYKKYGKDNAKYTHEFASRVGDEVLKKALEEKLDVILDGTLKSLKTPLERAKLFKENGYSVEINAIVVKGEKSYFSNLMRYEEMIEIGKAPRLAPKDVHDECIEGIPNTISEFYKTGIINNIKLYNRSNECLYNMEKTPNINPKDIILNEFEREWEEQEYFSYLEDWKKLEEKMKNRNAEKIEFEIMEDTKKEILEKITVTDEKDFEKINSKNNEKVNLMNLDEIKNHLFSNVLKEKEENSFYVDFLSKFIEKTDILEDILKENLNESTKKILENSKIEYTEKNGEIFVGALLSEEQKNELITDKILEMKEEFLDKIQENNFTKEEKEEKDSNIIEVRENVLKKVFTEYIETYPKKEDFSIKNNLEDYLNFKNMFKEKYNISIESKSLNKLENDYNKIHNIEKKIEKGNRKEQTKVKTKNKENEIEI